MNSSSSPTQYYQQHNSSPLSTKSVRSTTSNATMHSTSSNQSQSQQQQYNRSRILLLLLGLCSAGVIIQTANLDGLRQSVGMTGMSSKTKTAATVADGSSSKHNNNRFLPVDGNAQQQADEESQESQHPLGTLYVPSLDFRLKGVSQYQPDADFEAHIYCKEFAKDLKWEWWQADKSARSLEGVVSAVASAGGGGNSGSSFRQTTISSSSATSALSTITTDNGPAHRLMIGLYAGHDDYARLLERAVWSARVYGQKWGQHVTVVTLQGTAFAPHGCKAPSTHSTLNKIRLLFHAIDHRRDYDQVLILDADSFVFNLDTDITTLLDEDHHVVAGQHIRQRSSSLSSRSNDQKQLPEHRRWPGIDDDEPWMIHSGATLWNLHHPLTTSVAMDWFEGAKSAIVRGTYVSDEKYLQSSLRSHVERQRAEKEDGENTDDEEKEIPIVLNFQNGEFDYSHGKVVKQFIREDFEQQQQLRFGKNMTTEELNTERLHKMDDASKRMCARHSKECESVPVPQYETS
jgi:hypothetical protein